MAYVIHIRGIVDAMMLSLRRRYLERFIDAPFDARISSELDAVIVAQEQHTQLHG